MVIKPLSYNKILMEVYSDLMYLPLGPFRNSYSTTMYEFVVSTTNSVINLAIIISNQKSTMHVNYYWLDATTWSPKDATLVVLSDL